MTVDKDYFDAKFEGIEKIMTVQEANLKGYIGAVSTNVKRVEMDLAAHKESSSAHGLESARHSASAIVSWLGFLTAGALGVVELIKRKAQ